MKNGIAKLLGIGFSASLAFIPSTAFADTMYIVKAGDTMSEIANQYDLSLDELSDLNPQVKNLDLIFPGEYIETSFNKEVVSQEEVQESSIEITEKKYELEYETKNVLTVEATAYSTNQPSLSDYTFTGINLRQNPYVIAVDPNFIPLGSKVYIPGFGTYIAGDTGGDIKGNRIDIHITDLDAAWAFGRQTIQIEIVE